MKKISKLLLTGAIAFGLVACNNEDVANGAQEGNTNVSVTVSMSLNGTASTRALPDDYNNIGQWAGKDKIEELTVYLVDGSSVSSKTFTVGVSGTDYVINKSDNTITLAPQTSAAIRTTAGMKKVYVIVNPTAEVTAHLNKTPVAEFEKKYQEVAFVAANSGTNTTVSTSAQKLATKNGVADETIVMTNVAPKSLNVLPNITVNETIATTPKNRASLEVERAVSRVMVTTEKTSYEIPTSNTVGASILGTISNITWVLAQGENSFYVQRKSDWTTPNYGWIPTDNATYWGNAGGKYDYSGLFENKANKFGGTDVPTMTDYATKKVENITADLDANLSGKFVLPTTHLVGVKAASNYKKGNTVYALIRAQFTPTSEAYADGGSYSAEADFYVGENGKFYISAENSQDPAKGGVASQNVTKYVGGKVLYYAWANPDAVPDWYNSPVIRNNIYHIHITGFKNLGTNWNPLFPEDPNGETITNPDPKPIVKIPNPGPGTDPIVIPEPENPIKPEDPLTTLETWMSVDVTILPWQLHSYKVELGI